MKTDYFFSTGDPGVAGFCSGFCSGWAAGVVVAALSSGLAAGTVAAAGAFSPPTTDVVSRPDMIHSPRDVSMKMMADAVVTLDSRVALPREPKAV